MPKSKLSWVRSRSILQHSGIWRAAYETVLNKVLKKSQNSPFESIGLIVSLHKWKVQIRQNIYRYFSLISFYTLTVLRMTKGSASGVSAMRPKARGLTRTGVQLSLTRVEGWISVIYTVIEHFFSPSQGGADQLLILKKLLHKSFAL